MGAIHSHIDTQRLSERRREGRVVLKLLNSKYTVLKAKA